MGSYAVPLEVYVAGLVFARVGAIFMLLPGLGESAVPPRVRLGLALILSLVLFPLAAPQVAAIPVSSATLGLAVIKEVLIGLMIGGLLRMFLGALAVAGEAVSLQTTLSFAQTANPMQAQPGTTIASFLGVLGITLIFATNLHHLFIGAIARSYTLFPPAGAVPVSDAADMAAPVIVFSLVLNMAAGLIGRVMPQFQVFFAVAPLTILIGLSVFALSLGIVGLVFIERYEAFVRPMAVGGAGGG